MDGPFSKTAHMLAIREAMMRRGKSTIIVSARRWGKTAAGERPAFVIFDEVDLVGDVMGSIEKLERDRSWDARKQKPPEQVEQKKRGPGVVLMRDRSGKLVERKL